MFMCGSICSTDLYARSLLPFGDSAFRLESICTTAHTTATKHLNSQYLLSLERNKWGMLCRPLSSLLPVGSHSRLFPRHHRTYFPHLFLSIESGQVREDAFGMFVRRLYYF